jgi:hypothetical protein
MFKSLAAALTLAFLTSGIASAQVTTSPRINSVIVQQQLQQSLQNQLQQQQQNLQTQQMINQQALQNQMQLQTQMLQQNELEQQIQIQAIRARAGAARLAPKRVKATIPH